MVAAVQTTENGQAVRVCLALRKFTNESMTQFARQSLFTFIEGWYNPRRRHSALGQTSPANFERRHRDNASATAKHGEHGIPTVGVRVAGATPPVDIPAPEIIEPT